MCSCSSLVLFPGAKKVSVESEQSPSLWICECIQLLSPDIFIQFIDFRPLYHTIINQPNRLVRNWKCESFGGISFYSASIICTMGGVTTPLLTVTLLQLHDQHHEYHQIPHDMTWYYLLSCCSFMSYCYKSPSTCSLASSFSSSSTGDGTMVMKPYR